MSFASMHNDYLDPDKSGMFAEAMKDGEEPLESVLARLWEAAVEEVNLQACAIWNDTHGCDTCHAHWLEEVVENDEVNGAVPVWADCPDCEGDGIVI